VPGEVKAGCGGTPKDHGGTARGAGYETFYLLGFEYFQGSEPSLERMSAVAD